MTDRAPRRWFTALALAIGLYPSTMRTLAAAQDTPANKLKVQTEQSQAAMTPAKALQRLKDGNARFAANTMTARNWSAKVVATASGQFPFAVILGCMDSRAPTEIIFDQGIG